MGLIFSNGFHKLAPYGMLNRTVRVRSSFSASHSAIEWSSHQRISDNIYTPIFVSSIKSRNIKLTKEFIFMYQCRSNFLSFICMLVSFLQGHLIKYLDAMQEMSYS